MKDFTNLGEYTPKKLRTLRNNLNNRLESFQLKGGSPKELKASHILSGVDEVRCKKLLEDVQKVLRSRS